MPSCGFGFICTSAPIRHFVSSKVLLEVSAMPKILLLGRVLPMAASVNISELPTTNWKAPDAGLDMNFKVHIQNNNIVVDCEINKWDKNRDLMNVYMRALDTTRAIVDVISFSSGIGLTTLLDTLVEPNGVKSQIVGQQPELAVISTSVKNDAQPTKADDNNLDKVLRLVLTDVSLFRALRDLIDAITETHVSPIACGRAMEGLKHSIAPGLERKKGWAKMNEILRIDRNYLDLITSQSIGPRHADPAHVTGAICREITIRSWTIMNRYFEYRKRGSQPLPESEFPVLR
jgi:hypothetical protein